MTKAKQQEIQQAISLPEIKIERFNITLIGDSPLICHAWSEKAKKEMLDKQMKKATAKAGGRAAKDPWMDFCDSLYWLTEKPAYPTEEDVKNAKFGFPAVAFKAAAVDSCIKGSDISKVAARGAFHIATDMVEIIGTPTSRQDMVRIAMGSADIRYRGEFREWSCVIPIRYNTNSLSVEQIVNLFNIAGFSVGVGEWRPQRDGSFGMFRVN